jgi:putative transposase
MLRDHFPIVTLCHVLDLAPSTYFYQAQTKEESAGKRLLVEVAGAWPTYGARRLSHELQRRGQRIGRQRTGKWMAALGLRPKRKRRPLPTTQSSHPYPRYPNLVAGLAVVHPDQVWVGDITHVRLSREVVYLAIVMDVFTRQIRGWHLSRSLDHTLTKTALQRALVHGRPRIHHSDQGGQYATPHYTTLLSGVQISMAAVGQAWQNGYAERLIRTIKEEEIELSEYSDFADAWRQLGHFIDTVYAHKRIHSALGYLTPAEFEAQWQQQHTDAE